MSLTALVRRILGPTSFPQKSQPLPVPEPVTQLNPTPNRAP